MSYVMDTLSVVEGEGEKPKSLTDIVKSFAPYHTMDAFGKGFVDYQHGQHNNPHDDKQGEGVKAQAWDRGHMAASLAKRHGFVK